MQPRFPLCLVVSFALVAATVSIDGQQRLPRPAVPAEPVAAILDAFRSHQIVALGDAHGDQPGEAFQLALIRDRRFPTVVNDILLEYGNAQYQDVMDRFIAGADVPNELLRGAWQDTTQPQAESWEMPELFRTVRALNASLPPGRRLRILFGDPPIDWSVLRTSDDLRQWQSNSEHDRDRFAADVIRRDILAKGRRGLALYGAGHFFRKNVTHSIVSLLEDAGTTKAFTIWTNAAADLSSVQADAASWQIPSLTMLSGTTLGAANFATYLGPLVGTVPEQWRVPIQDQFDALLYLGPLSAFSFVLPSPWPCSSDALAEHLRRMELSPLSRPQSERLKQNCNQNE